MIKRDQKRLTFSAEHIRDLTDRDLPAANGASGKGCIPPKSYTPYVCGPTVTRTV